MRRRYGAISARRKNSVLEFTCNAVEFVVRRIKMIRQPMGCLPCEVPRKILPAILLILGGIA